MLVLYSVMYEKTTRDDNLFVTMQVSITADEPCVFLQLDTDQLNCLAVTNPPLKFLLDCLIGESVLNFIPV